MELSIPVNYLFSIYGINEKTKGVCMKRYQVRQILIIYFSIFLYLISSYKAHGEEPFHDAETYQIKIFCQDMNVILQKFQAISSNIANHKTTRTQEGGPYKRQIIRNCNAGFCSIEVDQSPPLLIYQPDHPDAGTTGYVPYPNFNLQQELANLKELSRVYDYIKENIPVSSKFLLIGDKFKDCFSKYKEFENTFNLKKYLGR